MRIELPLQAVSVNAAYTGRRFKSKLYKQLARDVSKLLPRGHKTIDTECRMSYAFYFKSRYTSRDTSNYIKVIEDILVENGVLKDDSLVQGIQAEKFRASEDRIVIEFYPMK